MDHTKCAIPEKQFEAQTVDNSVAEDSDGVEGEYSDASDKSELEQVASHQVVNFLSHVLDYSLHTYSVHFWCASHAGLWKSKLRLNSWRRP